MHGIFPMHIQIENKREIGWWSPQQRGILPLNKINISSSLKKSMKKYFVTFDQDFDSVIDGCGDDKRPKGWINKDIKTAYKKLFELGYVHSVEVWNKKDELVGGLYGVEVNGLFAGESMFHTQTDASKTALVYLVEKLSQVGGERIFDVQWQTPHLKSMGVVKISRSKYISLLPEVMNTKPAF
jgi:leucyl/phenylalanyl-tRNA--protein transferase